jgi:hypothetical protein
MRPILRKLLSCTLLAAYAGISLIGEGLHELAPGHEHHHGLHVVSCEAHSHSHHGHDHHHHDHGPCHDDHETPPTGLIVKSGAATHTHTCDICEFLAQAVSQPPQIAATPDLHVLVADLPCSTQVFIAPTIVGLHAPRGPPQLLA